MRIAVFTTLVSFAVLAQAATGYRSVSPSGEVTFSDKPAAGAQAITIPDAQTYDPNGKAPPAPPAAVKPQPKPTKPVKQITYKSLSVVQPGANQTLSYRPDGIPVVVALSPSLQEGCQVVITLDGETVSRGSALAVSVPKVYRGAHTVSASVVDKAGKTLISSSTTTFYVIQHSILNK